MENTSNEDYNRLREFYNKSKYYVNTKHNFAESNNRFRKYTLKNVFSIYFPSNNEKVLDIGCGWGNISLELQKNKIDVIGIDYSKKAIEICQKSAENLNLNPEKFICADATSMGFKKERFDAVYCSDIVEHLYPEIYYKMIMEIFRVLKKNGRLIIYTPNPKHYIEILKKNDIINKDVSHVDYKTKKFLEHSLNNAGFKIIKSFYIESHLPIIRSFEKLFLSFIPIFRRRIAILAIKK